VAVSRVARRSIGSTVPGSPARAKARSGEPNAQAEDEIRREEALQDHGTGKVLYAQRGKRHGMIKRTNKQIRNLRGTTTLFEADAERVKKYFLPNG
jgi:large subunit ribosomal protein L35